MENSFEQQKRNIIDSFDFDEPTKRQSLEHQKQEIFDDFENIGLQNIKNEIPEKRVLKLEKLGIITNIDGYNWGCVGGDRFFVFANIKGIPVPMYKTSARTDGKREDLDFFPFFGYKDWLIKGTKDDTNTFYGIKELENISKILTEVFNFDTDRIKNNKKVNLNTNSKSASYWDDEFGSFEKKDNYIPEGKEITDNQKLNELLSKRFDIDFEKVGKMNNRIEAINYVSSKIINEINN